MKELRIPITRVDTGQSQSGMPFRHNFVEGWVKKILFLVGFAMLQVLPPPNCETKQLLGFPILQRNLGKKNQLKPQEFGYYLKNGKILRKTMLQAGVHFVLKNESKNNSFHQLFFLSPN